MKILMLVNWKVRECDEIPDDIQPPDYYVRGEDYWFFRYFREKPEVRVVDVKSFSRLEKFEKEKIRFYIWQSLKAIPEIKKYDLIVSHGMQSGVVISLFRRLFRTKAKHVVFDIGSFNSASEKGVALKLMQFASKSIDGIIYHTGGQLSYYKKFFPWLVDKSRFIKFGTDLEFFSPEELVKTEDNGKYIICVGYAKRDWDTLVKAYKQLDTDVKLRLIGKVNEKYCNIPGIEQLQFVPIKELINQIYNSLFCVLPLESFNYSFGQMTLMQQMALGKCVVAAQVPSLTDYIRNMETAITYEAGNSDSLAEKLKLVMNDGRLRNDIAEKGRKYLFEKCCEPIMAQEIELFLKETADK